MLDEPMMAIRGGRLFLVDMRQSINNEEAKQVKN